MARRGDRGRARSGGRTRPASRRQRIGGEFGHDRSAGHEAVCPDQPDLDWDQPELTQYTKQPTGPAGSHVTVTDTAPTTDHWDLAAVELINSGD